MNRSPFTAIRARPLPLAWALALLALGGSAAGCDPASTRPDAAPLDAVDEPDAEPKPPAMDAPATEVSHPADAADSADVPARPPPDPLLPVEHCGDVPVFRAEDLSTTHGRTTLIRIPEEAFGPRRLSAGDACVQRGVAQAVIRYVPRTTSRLIVRRTRDSRSLFHAGTHWIYQGCSAGAATDVLACGSDILSGSFTMTARTRRRVTAGVPVFLVYDASAATSVGVAITEVPDTLPVGSECKEDGLVATCEQGASCVWSPAGDVRRCTRDGTARGATCRDGAPRCDPGLTCLSESGLTLDAICQDTGEVAPDRECSYERPCAFGTCLPTALGLRCLLRGQLGTRCRDTTTPCDGGLTCTAHPVYGRGRCAPGAIPAGARCDPSLKTGACESGTWCTPVDDSSRETRCRPFGSVHAPCRASAPYCDDGLGCNERSQCVPVGSPGATPLCRPLHPRCDRGGVCDGDYCSGVGEPIGGIPCSSYSPRCTGGAVCVGPPGAGHCAAPGQEGGWCQSSARPCDAGLLCNARGLCAAPPPLPPGQYGIEWDTPCPDEGRFITQPARCAPLGEADGYCRVGNSPCAPGLRCSDAASSLLLAPVCQRTFRRDEDCTLGSTDSVDPLGCEPGYACQVHGTARVCAPIGTAWTPCDRAHPERLCVAGTTCDRALCVPTSLSGPCDTGLQTCPGGYFCENGCRPLSERGTLGRRCRATAPHCDPGLHCTRADGNGSCVDPAARIEVCYMNPCQGAGEAWEVCRPYGAPCASGLECNGRCGILPGLNEPCSAQGCRSPLTCSAGRCIQGEYEVTRVEGAPMIDVCAMPAQELPERFPFRLFGRDVEGYSLTSTLDLGFSATEVGSCDVSPLSGYTIYAPDDPTTCVRVEGRAPSRRLLVEWVGVDLHWYLPYPAGDAPRSAEGSAAYEVILEEATGAVEMRFFHAMTPMSPPVPLLLSPTLRCAGRSVGLAGIPVRLGTSIRFVPRRP